MRERAVNGSCWNGHSCAHSNFLGAGTCTGLAARGLAPSQGLTRRRPRTTARARMLLVARCPAGDYPPRATPRAETCQARAFVPLCSPRFSPMTQRRRSLSRTASLQEDCTARVRTVRTGWVAYMSGGIKGRGSGKRTRQKGALGSVARLVAARQASRMSKTRAKQRSARSCPSILRSVQFKCDIDTVFPGSRP